MPYSQDPPDPPDAASTSFKFYPYGYTLKKLSGNGIVGATNGSIGAFSYGNPALLNLHNKIDFIAIDIEGAEFKAFNGMKKILQLNSNLKIFTEQLECCYYKNLQPLWQKDNFDKRAKYEME